MKTLNMTVGIIITLDQEDKVDNLLVMPIWKWLLKK